MAAEPEWLKEFVDQVCTCLCPIEDMPPIGCHTAYEEDTWEISVFVSPTEIVGGQHDGQRLPCTFVVELIDLLQLFDVVESAGWQPHPQDESDEIGNHVAVEGIYAGHRIWLRVLAETPGQYAPGRYLNVFEQRFLDTWHD
ncbi:hypothetical protein SH661x_000120 [Planctomicrobium sp. SH661]|uniref:hypothetical protein n=1 Tax=Planctomicrobium sp. SH661 TaxID=3448124 RepID=UPI003F5C02D9